jgi:Cys-rich repeat protein
MLRQSVAMIVGAGLLFGAGPLFAEGPGPCSGHSECPADMKCDVNTGECVTLAENDCRTDSDCPDTFNQYCETRNAICRYYCNSDNQCIQNEETGVFEYCDMDTYHCELIPTDGDADMDGESRFCTEDWDCEVGEYCDLIEHACVPRCTGDADCPEGEYCMSGRCENIDGDEDFPWEYPDEDVDVDEFEIPADYDMPGVVDGDVDQDDIGGNSTGGLSDCPSGQVCVNPGDADQDDASSGCRQAPRSPSPLGWIGILPVFALLGLRRVRRL